MMKASCRPSGPRRSTARRRSCSTVVGGIGSSPPSGRLDGFSITSTGLAGMRSSVTARRRMLCSTDSDSLTVGSPAPALRMACTSCDVDQPRRQGAQLVAAETRTDPLPPLLLIRVAGLLLEVRHRVPCPPLLHPRVERDVFVEQELAGDVAAELLRAAAAVAERVAVALAVERALALDAALDPAVDPLAVRGAPVGRLPSRHRSSSSRSPPTRRRYRARRAREGAGRRSGGRSMRGTGRTGCAYAQPS